MTKQNNSFISLKKIASSSCHFRSYTISSSSILKRRSRELRIGAPSRAMRWGILFPSPTYWIICSSGRIPHSSQLLSITIIWLTSAIAHPWSIMFPWIFVKNKHKRRLRRTDLPRHTPWACVTRLSTFSTRSHAQTLDSHASGLLFCLTLFFLLFLNA